MVDILLGHNLDEVLEYITAKIGLLFVLLFAGAPIQYLLTDLVDIKFLKNVIVFQKRICVRLSVDSNFAFSVNGIF